MMVPQIDKVVGRLLWRGVSYRIKIEPPYLILDAFSWARRIVKAREADICDGGSNLTDAEVLELRQEIAKLNDWIKGRAKYAAQHIGLAYRQSLCPWTVNLANRGDYAARILERAETAGDDEQVEYVMALDGALPTLHAGPSMWPYAECSGVGSKGILLPATEVISLASAFDCVMRKPGV
jgi:hypothetical protein